MRKLAIILSLIFIASIAVLINYEQPVKEQKQLAKVVGNDYRTPSGCGYGSKSAAFTAMLNMYIGPDEVLTNYSFYVENGKWCFRMLIECLP